MTPLSLYHQQFAVMRQLLAQVVERLDQLETYVYSRR